MSYKETNVTLKSASSIAIIAIMKETVEFTYNQFSEKYPSGHLNVPYKEEFPLS